MRIDRWKILLASALLCAVPTVFPRAQLLQPLYVIDHPTAGMLQSREYIVSGKAGPESSFLASLRIGFAGWFQVGASFGVQRVFEHGEPTFNDRVGLLVRVRLLQEGKGPALAFGFSSQGQGVYHNDAERYDRKSPGFYAVASKNFDAFLGQLSVHGGANVTTEGDNTDPSFFAGLDWLLFDRLSFLLDTDAALNDNSDNGFGKGGVYVDAGVRLFYGESLMMTLIFRDLSANFEPAQGVGREFELAFIQLF